MIPNPQSSETDIDDKQARIETLGRLVNNQNQEHFQRMICSTLWSGVVDITDWTFQAVTALVRVCSNEKLVLTFKQGSRYFMPVHYPSEPLLESFAKMIMTGHF
jgi:hypothetical protein